VLAIMVSTWWMEGMRVTLEAGIPWLLVLSACYFGWRLAHRGAGRAHV
jgi:hypothetical protein